MLEREREREREREIPHSCNLSLSVTPNCYVYNLSTIHHMSSTTLIPVYSGNAIVSGDLTIFSANKSFLFRKRMIDVSSNHLLLQIESNNFMLSIIRFCTVNKTV